MLLAFGKIEKKGLRKGVIDFIEPIRDRRHPRERSAISNPSQAHQHDRGLRRSVIVKKEVGADSTKQVNPSRVLLAIVVPKGRF